MEQALATAPGDISRSCQIANRIGELRRKEFVRLVRSIAEVHAILTEEQRARLDKIKF